MISGSVIVIFFSYFTICLLFALFVCSFYERRIVYCFALALALAHAVTLKPNCVSGIEEDLDMHSPWEIQSQDLRRYQYLSTFTYLLPLYS
jgi:hypothetical protein